MREVVGEFSGIKDSGAGIPSFYEEKAATLWLTRNREQIGDELWAEQLGRRVIYYTYVTLRGVPFGNIPKKALERLNPSLTELQTRPDLAVSFELGVFKQMRDMVLPSPADR